MSKELKVIGLVDGSIDEVAIRGRHCNEWSIIRTHKGTAEVKFPKKKMENAQNKALNDYWEKIVDMRAEMPDEDDSSIIEIVCKDYFRKFIFPETKISGLQKEIAKALITNEKMRYQEGDKTIIVDYNGNISLKNAPKATDDDPTADDDPPKKDDGSTDDNPPKKVRNWEKPIDRNAIRDRLKAAIK